MVERECQRAQQTHSENLQGSGKKLKGKYFKQIFIKLDSLRKPSHRWVQSPAPSRMAMWLQANHLITLR